MKMQWTSVSFLALAIAAALPASAKAEETGSAKSAPTDAAKADDGDIVVTAQRRSERTVDVPISIVTQTSAQLQGSGVTSTLNLQQVVPGVVINRFGTFTAPAIRGISTRVVGAGADNNVATYIDGFYIANAVSINRGFGDIEQLDVIKGPQGTLFGRNATGGAIMITTRQPSDTFHLEGNFGLEENNTVRGDIYVTGGIASGLSASVTYSHMDSDGWYKNISPGLKFPSAPQKARYVRGKIKWEPSSNLSFLLTGEHGYMRDATALVQAFYAHPLSAATDVPVLTGPYESALSHQQLNGDRWSAAYLKSSLDLGFTMLTSYTGYREDKTKTYYDLDGTPGVTVTTANFRQRFWQRTFSQELNLTSKGNAPLNWVLGLYYYNDRAGSRHLGMPNYLQLRSNTKSLAGYADATWEVADNLFLTGGLRYTTESKTCARAVLQNDPITPCPDAKETSNSFTPRAVVRYQLSPESNIYASYSRGFKSGNFNNGNPYNYVKPETIDAYEIGFKHAQPGFRFETSAFYYDYKNIQYSALCQVGTCAGILVSTNAARSEIYGMDASLNAKVTSAFTIGAGIAYTHARFKDFPNASSSVPTDFNNPDSPNKTVIQDWSGQQLIRSPDWSGNINASYDIPTDIGDFRLGANLYYTDDYQPNSDSLPCNTTGCGVGTTPRLRTKAYALANANIDWTAPGGKFSFSIFVRNLTDKLYIIQTDSSSRGDYAIYGEPRTFGFRAGVSF